MFQVRCIEWFPTECRKTKNKPVACMYQSILLSQISNHSKAKPKPWLLSKLNWKQLSTSWPEIYVSVQHATGDNLKENSENFPTGKVRRKASTKRAKWKRSFTTFRNECWVEFCVADSSGLVIWYKDVATHHS